MSDPKQSPSDSQNEKTYSDEQILDFYNDVVIGLDVLYEATLKGNKKALKALVFIAEETIQAAGDKDSDLLREKRGAGEDS